MGFTAHKHKKAISRRPVLEMNSENHIFEIKL